MEHLGSPSQVGLPIGASAEQVMQPMVSGGLLLGAHLLNDVLGMLGELGELRALGLLGELSELRALGMLGELDLVALAFARSPSRLPDPWILLAHFSILDV